MMAKINMDELRADREAGTDGKWRAVPHGGSSTVTSESKPQRNDTRIPAYAYRDEHCIAYPFIEEDLRCRWDFVCFSHADARRIARLPDLEAAYLEAVGLLERWNVWACGQQGYSPFQDARAFLERNT